MKKICIVIGMGYGDEGKGVLVNSLCKDADKPIVVRFSGGHQVGHTVVYNEKRHVFSNFGSGSLRGVDTFWSENCTVNPMSVLKEGLALKTMGINPHVYFDANAMVTTPFDILRNMKLEEFNKHGSVGVGFGTTIQRNEDYYHLYVRDLQYPKIRDIKLDNIMKKYYNYTSNEGSRTEKMMNEFKDACNQLVNNYTIVDGLDFFNEFNTIIFEGNQGIMLDKDYGFFPHVTRCNTTSKNAFDLLRKFKIDFPEDSIETHYVTRAYQTRHGNGQMTNEGLDISYIKDNPFETNLSESYQGAFRKSVLDVDSLRYAYECDRYHNYKSKKFLNITCLDQIDNPDKLPVTMNGELIECHYGNLALHVGIKDGFHIFSDKGF